MLHELKNLAAAIRSQFPVEPSDCVIRATFITEAGDTYLLNMDGVPPNDVITIYKGEDVLLTAKNWGASTIEEVTRDESFIDTPKITEIRRARLKKDFN